LDPVGGDGRFAHLAGMEVTYDLLKPGFMFNLSGTVTVPAQRVLDIVLGGVPVLDDGVWLVDPVATTVDLATLNFSASGGDQYFRTTIGGTSTYLSQLYNFTSLGVTDQNALQDYIEFMANGNISFDISTFKPEYAIQQRFSGGRISVVPEPASVAFFALGAAGALWAVRRKMNLTCKVN
jgi:hypothetical protein